MHSRSVVFIVLLLLLSLTPSDSRRHSVTPGVALSQAAALPPEIDTQLQNIAALSDRRAANGRVDPRLFSALLRLEEMLPRSAATRRAQDGGKKIYLAMHTARSAKLWRRWADIRESIERQARADVVYSRALDAVDRRLAGAPGIGASGRNPDASPKLRSLPFGQMRPGDIMIWDDRSGPPLVRCAISMFACRCTHTAIYLGEMSSRGAGVRRWTLEAQSPALGVRTSVMDRKWTRPGLHVSLGHVRGFAPARAARIASNAVEAYGSDGRTPYHIWPPWDKTYYREGVYCSQLVWRIYQQNGVDLDSNDWHYLAWFTVHNWFNPYAAPTAYFGVFPDEIKASPRVEWYYDQVNP